jgi:hypothetical protein
MSRKLLAGLFLVVAAGAAAAGPIRRTYISEMSANPRSGSVTANLHHAWASHVALRALGDPMDIRRVTLHMSDGRSYLVPYAIRLRPGEEGVVALPCRTRCTIDAISLEYDPRDQREGARVRIYALDETDASPRFRHPAYDWRRPYDNTPSDRVYR